MAIVIIMFVIVLLCALFIARFVYRKLEKNESRWSTLLSAVSFVISFLMIAVTAVVILLMNVDFGR